MVMQLHSLLLILKVRIIISILLKVWVLRFIAIGAGRELAYLPCILTMV